MHLVSSTTAVAQHGNEGASGNTPAQPRAPIGQVLDSTMSMYQFDGHLKWQKLIWAGFTEPRECFVASDLRAAVISTTRSSSYHKSLSHMSWLDGREFRRLHALLGEGFICGTPSKPDVHQSVVTVKCIDLLTSNRVSVELQAWDNLSEELQRLQTFRYNISARPRWFSESKNTILFIQPTAIEVVGRIELANMYKAIRLLQPGYGAQLRAYPNEVEMEKEHYKLGDIEALDYIANQAIEWKYQYRPLTCFRPGICTLTEFHESVHKRVNSDCAKHVEIRNRWAREGLICNLPEAKEHHGSNSGIAMSNQKPSPGYSTSEIVDTSERWFHQEYVASLSKSEYRVFIVAQPGADSLRGRSRRILKILLTSSASFRDTSNKNILAREQTPYNCHQYQELEEFALYIFDELRRLPGAALEFESLDVGGVRLDIATSDLDPSAPRSRFFVNEITRWHSAYFFSTWACPSPHTQICEAFATAFCSYFFPEENESDPTDVEMNS
jgi:hypothetical protein